MFSAVVLIIACICFLPLKINQFLRRGPRRFFKEPQNYIDVAIYLTVVIFVFPVGHRCWCFPSWKWQTGALAVFLAWINTFVSLRHIPFIGQPITMLFNVYAKFLVLLYLPILLILTFAFPFYMLFISSIEVCWSGGRG